MTTRDISEHLSSAYGVDASAEMISHMTDRILPVAKEWQNRLLEKKYAIFFMDAVHFHVRQDNQTVKKAVYPRAEIQRCIVHQIRYSTKFISYKDIRPFIRDLKKIYQAAMEETALDGLEDIWRKKYPASVASWRNNWPQLSAYFKYPGEIRKVTKNWTIFPVDDALLKLLYLAMMNITKKWTGRNWN